MSEKRFSKISVVGLGYIGLPTAAMFASRKIEVVGVDVNQQAVDTVNRGEIHIVEPDLDLVVQAAVKDGYLRATTKAEPAEAFLIAVPTPFKGDNHEPDLRYIKAAAMAISPVLQSGNLVILESTSPVGATEKMADWLAEARPDLSFPKTKGEKSDIRVAHCPERVLPGKVMQELITNDRVIGGLTPACSDQAAKLYQNFVTGECVIASGPRAAEMTKLTENSFRDVNIAFANEVSIICDNLGMDVWEVIKLANRHPRVNILKPGPGVGGHCIAVDPWFIVSSAPKEAKLIKLAREVNDRKPYWVVEKIRKKVAEIQSVKGFTNKYRPSVAFMGVTFKPNIDDCRESPAIQIVKNFLTTNEVNVFVVEPNLKDLPKELASAKKIEQRDALKICDLCVVLVGHDCFEDFSNRTTNQSEMSNLLKFVN